MSKELEALEHWFSFSKNEIETFSLIVDEKYRNRFKENSFSLIKEDKDIIETALKELNDIKFGKIRLSVEHSENYIAMPKYQYEQDLKKLKALEIIKNKNVNCCLINQCKNAREYNQCLIKHGVVGARHFNITKQEYDLLKEILL